MGSLATELRRIRKITGYSLRDVENQTDISNAYLSQLERGSAKRPSADKLTKLASVYGVDPRDFLALAGYIPSNSEEASNGTKNGESRALSAAMRALLATDFNEEEEQQLLDFAAFLRSKRTKMPGSSQ